MIETASPSQTIQTVSHILTRNRVALVESEYLGSGEYCLTARDPETQRTAAVEVGCGFASRPTAHRLIDALRA